MFMKWLRLHTPYTDVAEKGYSLMRLGSAFPERHN
jgi:hypothetical protein